MPNYLVLVQLSKKEQKAYSHSTTRLKSGSRETIRSNRCRRTLLLTQTTQTQTL